MENAVRQERVIVHFGDVFVKKVLYILNDCMRKFSYERAAGLYRALLKLDEPFNLYILRSNAYFDFTPEHNYGEYNIYRLPEYSDFDGILLDINSVFIAESTENDSGGIQLAVQAAAASGKPVISMANKIPGFRYAGINNYDAMSAVMRHLHEDQGLDDFWFALGPADNYENRERTKGALDYCASHGIPCGEDRQYAESFIIECGIHAFHTLQSRHDGKMPQAIVCANDHIAAGVCFAAKEAGYRIPDDFLVTGFDNTELSVSLSPPITTVDQQCWTMGDACIEALRRIWDGEEVPETINTPTKLVLRESTKDSLLTVRDTFQNLSDFIGSSSSATDFNYKMSALQYCLPACKSVEEICRALVDCVSVLNCEGLYLILDGRLFDSERILSFHEQTGHMHDISSGLSVDGYSDSMELVFRWKKGHEPLFFRQKTGKTLSSLTLEDKNANYLFVPIHFMEYTAGYLCLQNCLDLMRIKGVSAIVSTLTMALRSFFSEKSLSYINYVLSGISMKDELTGLYNRLGFHELAYPLYRDITSRGGKLAILFIDMDRLKFINDAYGHSSGDQAIVCISDAIRRNIPPEALSVRYGGDEFLILLPCSRRENVEQLMNAITEDVSARAAVLSLPEIPDFSYGYVLAEPDERKSLDDYVEEADALMYTKKREKKVQRG